MRLEMGTLGIFIVSWLVSGVLGDVTFVFVCQNHETSLEQCVEHSQMLEQNGYTVVFSTDFDVDGDWTIFPLIEGLRQRVGKISKWIMFCTEHTVVNLLELMKLVDGLDDEGDVFVGRGLNDPGPVIIHHFSNNLDLKFPLLSAGFLISRSLFEKLEGKLNTVQQELDFSIDASYEIAQIISQIGVQLIHSDLFCLKKNDHCATFVCFPTCSKISQKFKLKKSEIFFAVKTCTKFHKNRLPVVHTTWGKEAKRINYYSDGNNEEIPTIVLSNVTNTDHGHCEKTREIITDLLRILKTDRTVKWVVITDDDTILSVSRIVELLRYYNSSEPLALGERYGYNLLKGTGYNYLTGGAGVILSQAAVKKFKRHSCNCPSANTPDDMFLFGVCFKRLGIQLLHVPTMHQARPNDYSADLLAISDQISFHKHWMIDPKTVYEKWFNPSIHDEL